MPFPQNVRAVVTGAGSGLGRALVLELARPGARILVSDIDPARAKETADTARRAGAVAEAHECDVAHLEEVQAMQLRVRELWGGTDVLINNAGVAVAGPVGDVPIADWEWLLRINLWGVIYGCHAFLPEMKKARRGWVLNVASFAGLVSPPELATYSVSKAGVISLSESLNVECAPHGVAVSVLCPTFFKTNLLESMRSPTPRYRSIAQKFFDRSTSSAEEVARVGLEGLQRGRVLLVPQRDGQLIWRLKGLAPSIFARVARYAATSRMATGEKARS